MQLAPESNAHSQDGAPGSGLREEK